VEKLTAELNKILAMPDIAKRIQDLGGEVKAGPAANLAKWIESNTAAYATIIKEAGIKVQ
jgi:tripartite-type tricarboxylate transporter receptor subunit TctC